MFWNIDQKEQKITFVVREPPFNLYSIIFFSINETERNRLTTEILVVLSKSAGKSIKISLTSSKIHREIEFTQKKYLNGN